MTTATHSEREAFVMELTRLRPQVQPTHAQRLMRFASAYWRLTEKRNQDLLRMSPRDRAKLARTRAAVTVLCEEINSVPVFGAALHLSIDTGSWQKIVRVPCI